MRFVCVVGLVAALCVACSSEDTDGPGGGTGTAGSGGTGGTSTGTATGSGGNPGGSGPGGGGSSGLTDPHECASPDSAWVFCSDFEESDWRSVWDDYDDNPDETNTLMDDAGPFSLAGNHVMRLRVPPGRGLADLVKELDGSYDRLYARWYVKYEPGFDFTAPNHGGGLHAGDHNWLGHSDDRPQGNDWFCSWIEHTSTPTHYAYTYYRGMYQDCANPNGQCWGDHFPCTADEGNNYCEKPQHRDPPMPPELDNDRWYCIEMMMDAGTAVSSDAQADGQLDFWVDEQEIGPWTDLWFRTTDSLQLEILWLSLFHHGDHSVEGLMLDHVVVSTERIRCP